MSVAVYKLAYVLGCSGRRLQEIQGENSKVLKGWLYSDRRVCGLRDGYGGWVFRGCWDWHVGDT